MKIALFGATGGTGKEVLSQALGNEIEVTACVRTPEKIADVTHSNLSLIEGDALDRSIVEQTVANQDAVISTLGAGAKRSSLREESTKVIIEAMEKLGVKRLISLSSLGVGESRKNLDFFTKYIIVDIFLRHAFADHEEQEKLIRECDLDWTIVRPPHLIDGPRTGEYQSGFACDYRKIKSKVSRADVADFMLKQLTDSSYLRQAVGVSY